ncbi:hypothetical protein YB2330_003682 [Saitoella coloradoensis]
MSPSKPISLTHIVAATSSSLGIGKSGGLPWRLRKEMAYFAKITTAVPASPSQPSAMNAVIMGRKCWESIPPKFRPLKGRVNVVISRAERMELGEVEHAYHVRSLPAALELLRKLETPLHHVFVIGGAQIYDAAMALPESKRILFTAIENEFECDTFFTPDFRKEGSGWEKKTQEELEQWVGVEIEKGAVNEGDVKYEYQMWERIQ